MKLYSITIFATEPNQPAINLAGEYDLSGFGFFQRSSASEEWNIQDFLEQCDVEPFDQKIDCYIKSLEAIVNHGGYKNNCQIARSWNNERSHNKELNDKTNNFFQNSSGQMSINIIENLGNLEIESNEKDNSNKIFNEEDKAGDNIDLDYVSKLNYSQVNQLENSDRVQLDLSSAIHTKIFEQMKAIYPKYNLPKVVEELCHHEALEEEIDNAHNDLRTNLSPSDKKLLRTSQNIWNHIAEYWQTSFDSPQTIEDTHVHHEMHLFLCPFSPNGPDRMIDWKTNDNGEGHKPDFMITVNKRSGKFEVVFGLFKLPYKGSSHFMNVDPVDLAVLMKDSLDYMYKEKCIEMYLLGEFELSKSNISLCLVENVLHEVEFEEFIKEYIERLPSYITNNENTKTPTEKMRITRRMVATSYRVEG
ncbi:12442_t:CDS:10 [Entrophospora sp. SA101]|nr:12442_t:CDS:10 [Entrophospora sp. SA101]